MKRVIFVFLSFLLFCCSPKARQHTDATNENDVVCIDTIIIHHVDFGIFAARRIPCDEFNSAFNHRMKRDTITDKKEIALLIDYLVPLKPMDSSTIKSIDTRAKLFLHSSTGITEFCIGRFKIYVNGEFYKMPDELFNYIERLDSVGASHR